MSGTSPSRIRTMFCEHVLNIMLCFQHVNHPFGYVWRRSPFTAAPLPMDTHESNHVIVASWIDECPFHGALISLLRQGDVQEQLRISKDDRTTQGTGTYSKSSR